VMSIAMRKVYDLARAYDTKLLATDRRFRRAIQIVHEDGTVLFIKNAFLMECFMEGVAWIIYFSEHNSFNVYARDDLRSYCEFDERYNRPGRLPKG
jgi:hypothetical protein